MFNVPPTPVLISYIIFLLICLPVHEFSHAFVANYFGDDTPRANGRLTLNPLVHLDLIGALVFLVAGFGWARPVPINPYALQKRSRSAVMWVSLAGPASNFALAILGAIPLRLGIVPLAYSASNIFPSLYDLIHGFVVINLVLAFFNLIPLAPLDGEKIADYLFPPPFARFMDTIRPYSSIILLVLIFVLPRFGINIIGWSLTPLLTFFFRLLTGLPG